jgi:cystathionine beta-synthase
VPAIAVPDNVLDLIGHTPMVELKGFDTGPCSVFLKLENQNPAGSIKDRIAVSMIRAAEKSGELRPGGTIVEATAGNTGLGLALVAAARGYRLILVIPDKMSTEKIAHLRAFGCDIRLTRSDVGPDHSDYYMNMAARITADGKDVFNVNQFKNPANPLAHELTTGPEIWEQLDHNIDAVVCGVGSGGTITGLSRFFARVSPHTELVLADPAGSAMAGFVNEGVPGRSGSYAVEGIGQSCVPAIADLSRVRKAYSIPDVESFETARDLLRRFGILGGSSSGCLVSATLRYCREQVTPKRVVTFICDTGNKYLSKMYNDYWMLDQGYIRLPHTGDLRDLLTRRYEQGALITVSPEDSLLAAFQRMRVADVSQVPVIEDGRPVGILDESDVLVAVHADESRFARPVRSAMTSRLETVAVSASLEEVVRVLDRGLVAIVMDGDRFLGLITRSDMLAHLRRRLK